MKKTIKTEHGTVTVNFKEGAQVEDAILEKAAAFLDRSGFECNAGTSRVEYRDEGDMVVGSMVWKLDGEPKEE